MLRQQMITKRLAVMGTVLAAMMYTASARATLVFHFDPNDTRTMFQYGFEDNRFGTVPATQIGDPVGWMMDTRVPSVPTPDPDNGLDGFIDGQQGNPDNRALLGYHPTGTVLNYLDTGNNDNLLIFRNNSGLADGFLTAADGNIGTLIIAGRVDPAGTGNSYLLGFLDSSPTGGVDSSDGFGLRYNHSNQMFEGIVKQSVAGAVSVPAGDWFVASYAWNGPAETATLSVQTAAGTFNDTAAASLVALDSTRLRIANNAAANSGLLGQLGDILYYNDIDDHSAVVTQLANDYLSIAQLIVNRETGNVSLVVPNTGGAITNVVGYSISSESNAIDATGWLSIADNYDAGNPGPNQRDPDNQWTKLTDSSSVNELAEFEFQGNGGANAGADFLVGTSTNFGNVWERYYREDLKIEVALSNDVVIELPVKFTGNDDLPFRFGDLDFSGEIDYDDLLDVLKPNYGMDTSALPLGPARYSLGDMDENGMVDLVDFLLLNEAYLAANPGASALSWNGAAVPEPATWAFALGGCIAFSARRFRRAVSLVALALLTCVTFSPQQSSAGTILEVDFEHLVSGSTIGNATRIQDSSGNRFHGFWGGGDAANNTPVQKAYGKVVVNNEDNQGYVILRPNLADGGPGAPNSWWGEGNTSSQVPYFDIEANKSYTFEAVLNWNGNTQANDGIMGLLAQTGDSEWWIRENNGNLEYVWDDGPNRHVNTGTININSLIDNSNWHHVGITFARDALDPGNVVVTSYIDYQQVHQESLPSGFGAITYQGNAAGDIRFGAYNDSAAARFDGLMAHFRISDEVLPVDQFLPVPIPEPTFWALSLIGCTILCGRRVCSTAFGLVLSIVALLTLVPQQSHATIGGVVDINLQHLVPGTTISDGTRIQDSSGNRFHGFWGGGANANNTPVFSPFPDAGAVINNEDNQGYIILRPNLEDGGPGSPNPWWGEGNTSNRVPYFDIEADKSYTFEAVLNWNGNTQANDGIMGLLAQTGASEWWIRENNGFLEYAWDDGPNRRTNTGTIDINSLIDNSDWHHVGITFARDALDPGNVVLTSYIDYQQVFQETLPAGFGTITYQGNATGDIRFGAYNDSAAARFDGYMRHFRISDEVLDVSDFLPLPQAPEFFIEVNTGNGIVKLKSETGGALDMDAYRLTSEMGTLSSALWNSLELQDYEEQGPDSGWIELGTSANELSEGFLGGSSILPSPTEISLGQIYTNIGNEDPTLRFEYHVPGTDVNSFIELPIQYVSGGVVPGDYNGDGFVNAADYVVWRNSLGSDTNLAADGNGNDVVDTGDYTYWKQRFGGSAGSGANLASAVPEPTSMFLLGSLAVAFIVRRAGGMARILVLAIGGLAVVTSTANADAFVDRQYTLGDDPFEFATPGGFPGLTYDSMGVNLNAFPGAINTGAYQDLIVTGAQYVDVGTSGLQRPGAGLNELGMTFNGVDNRLHSIASLNLPNNTWRNPDFFPTGIDLLYDPPSATGVDGTGDGEYRPAFPHSYAGINQRAMQAWVRPNVAGLNGTRQDVILDTNEHGFVITANNTWGMLFDDVLTDTEILVTDTLDSNGWVHLMALGGISKTNGPNTTLGGALLINGMVVASSNAVYDASAAVLSIGSNLAGTGNFYHGEIDDIEMLVWGNNSWRGPGATQQELGYLGGANWGSLAAEDNQWIAMQLEAAAMAASVPFIPEADVNLDGILQGDGTGSIATDDVSAFIAAYGFKNEIGAIPVGDWVSRQNGDLNFDGVADIRDALMLRDALLASGSGSFDLGLLNGTTVPEPSGVVLAVGLLSALGWLAKKRTSVAR